MSTINRAGDIENLYAMFNQIDNKLRFGIRGNEPAPVLFIFNINNNYDL
jgi:hypothetical protein